VAREYVRTQIDAIVILERFEVFILHAPSLDICLKLGDQPLIRLGMAHSVYRATD
jgi:hypothetical protein|tara:strand:- start:30720 stop:30884 length:165 start_codon:yes stop_codon:yes gene_type:complete